jgi:hypothetical protein
MPNGIDARSSERSTGSISANTVVSRNRRRS